ncbi:heat shock protein 30 [Colletotrichum sublineola]|uniref:Putative hsp20-like protein n=1 Tax=Colletotrichum sublineola TaxID=1173701 RepID=A0A066XB17_COLSU|nr:heat shock protein 30 [Colletotrichum sublineola]KDN64844.1 putative hsp20-like protein [Colletotrichum sublineola]
MAFFPRNFYNTPSDTSFTPLFRLLEDFDNYSRTGGASNGGARGSHRNHVPTFQPKFDVREVEDAYELHGELPGMNKNDVSIEFTDPHTLHIRGRVERSYTAGTPPAGFLQGGNAEMSGAITEGNEKSRQPTVEDENEKDNKNDSVEKSGKKEPVDNAKYWVSERSVGEFSRVFNFPGQISQDSVTASFKDGILSIRVPKAPRHETRRIQVN